MYFSCLCRTQRLSLWQKYYFPYPSSLTEPDVLKMRNEQELRFINSGSARLLLVVEPASSEFWIDRGASVKVVMEAPIGSASLEIEYLPGGWSSTCQHLVLFRYFRMTDAWCRANTLGTWIENSRNPNQSSTHLAHDDGQDKACIQT